MPNLRMNSTIQQQTNNSGSGYCKMSDGTLIQWGEIGVARASGINTSNLVYPIPFASLPSITVSVNTKLYADRLSVSYSELSTTNVNINIYNRGEIAPDNAIVTWMVIGRWK